MSSDTENITTNAPKVIKLDENLKKTQDNIHNDLKNLSDFKIEEILSNSTNRKTICLKGTFGGKNGTGIILLEKTAFSENDMKNSSQYFASECLLQKDFSNDIYGNYNFFPKVELNAIKTTVIHPATEKHIIKYSTQNIYLIDETEEMYKNITLPYLEKEQFSLEWVYNILDHISEKDRIVFEDNDPETGFILLPDLKWDNKTLDTLYLIAIIHSKGIKSIRDLTEKHVPLLENIMEKGIKAIESKYGLQSSQLRIYLHYQPSFYHLHVHFTYLKHDAPGIYTEKSHMLSTVISNLKLCPEYYQKVTLPFVLRESDKLFKIFLDKQYIAKLTQ